MGEKTPNDNTHLSSDMINFQLNHKSINIIEIMVVIYIFIEYNTLE